MQASARNPSHLISKSQSGWQNGAGTRRNGAGQNAGRDIKVSIANREGRPDEAVLHFARYYCVIEGALPQRIEKPRLPKPGLLILLLVFITPQHVVIRQLTHNIPGKFSA